MTIKAFLDTSVILSAFGAVRNDRPTPYVLSCGRIERVVFEKSIFECFLAFRGVGGKKPDEGRQDWARRFLCREGDPTPLGDSTGKLHKGSIHAAHFWVGQIEESMFAMPSSFNNYMEKVRKHVREEDWEKAENDWLIYKKIAENYLRYQTLFSEFKAFLSYWNMQTFKYHSLYMVSEQNRCLQIMESLSQRSTIPNEDFEIVVAALFLKPTVFVTNDRRLLKATASIESNIKLCDFIHLDDLKKYVDARHAES